uniref:D-alanine--D-alanine ligase n=2 Tax=Flavobacterium sp. TaxID=239 RepID=UPI0040492E12
MKIFFHKLFHWEYWPSKVIYFPIGFQWLFYAMKSGSFFFFKTCNPTFPNGGFYMDSKKLIYDLIPKQFYPKTLLINDLTSDNDLVKQFQEAAFTFPLMVKPDVGLRGSAVKKIADLDQLLLYNQLANFDFLIQDFIPYPNEMGVFYVRYPNQKTGIITGIVAKEFLVVEGNGIDCIEDLLLKNPRFAIQLKALRKEYGIYLKQVLEADKQVNLVPYGNHARGAKFLDRSDLISESLTNVIDEICSKIDGFYFGRIDLMYQDVEQLELGKHFSIVEVNGAASEPTHIYDPKHSLFFAWRELMRHVKMMFEISMMNKANGHSFLTFKEGVKQLKLHNQHNQKIIQF